MYLYEFNSQTEDIEFESIWNAASDPAFVRLCVLCNYLWIPSWKHWWLQIRSQLVNMESPDISYEYMAELFLGLGIVNGVMNCYNLQLLTFWNKNELQGISFEISLALKWCICDSKLLKPKCIWKTVAKAFEITKCQTKHPACTYLAHTGKCLRT